MRIAPLSMQNSISSKKNNPSFGITLVENHAAQDLVRAFKDYGVTKEQAKDFFKRLDQQHDSSITLAFDEVRRLYSDENQTVNYATKVYGTITNGVNPKPFTYYLRNDSLQGERNVEGLYQVIKTTSHLVGTIRKDARTASIVLVDAEYGKKSYEPAYSYEESDM